MNTNAPARQMRIGRIRPRRSATLPTSTCATASIAEAAMNVAAIAPLVAPSRSSASGTSTSIAPNTSAGTVTSSIATRIGRSPKRSPQRLLGSSPAPAGGASIRSATTISATPRMPTDANGSLGPHRPRERAQRRAHQQPDERRAHRLPDRRAALLGRRQRDQPAEPAGPRAGAADALQEAHRVEHRDRVAEREADARPRHQREPDQHRPAAADPHRQPAARQRAEQRARGVGAGEHSRAGLAQVEAVRVPRQQRRDGREEHEVDEDDRADEQEEPPHRSDRSGDRRSERGRRPDNLLGPMSELRYDPKTIEPRWQETWASERTWEVTNEPDGRDSYYVLEMLPYPSGEPHIGHLKIYSLGDAVAHFNRRIGRRVLHPMGYDAFGLPAENHAIRTGEHPRESTDASIAVLPAPVPPVGHLDRLDARVRHARAALLPLDAVDLPASSSSAASPTARKRPSSGARTTRPCSPTSRSRPRGPASAAAPSSRCASSSSGSSASPTTPTACSTTSPRSSGPSTSRRCSATGSAAPRAPRSRSAATSWGSTTPSSRRAPTRSSARRSS